MLSQWEIRYEVEMLSQWETLSYMSTTWVFGKYFLEEDFRSGGVLFMKVLKFLRLIICMTSPRTLPYY